MPDVSSSIRWSVGAGTLVLPLALLLQPVRSEATSPARSTSPPARVEVPPHGLRFGMPVASVRAHLKARRIGMKHSFKTNYEFDAKVHLGRAFSNTQLFFESTGLSRVTYSTDHARDRAGAEVDFAQRVLAVNRAYGVSLAVPTSGTYRSVHCRVGAVMVNVLLDDWEDQESNGVHYIVSVSYYRA